MGGLFSYVGEPYSLFAVDAYPHISTQPCQYLKKSVGKMTHQRNYRTGRIIVKISLLSAAAGTISHPLDAPPPLICAVY